MEYLATSDQTYAEAKAALLNAEIMVKRVRARVFVTASGGSVEARKAAAEVSREAIEADDALIDATLVFEGLKAKRSRAEIVIDIWRSLEASRRKA